MATKLQKYELQKLLEKYGGVLRSKDNDSWNRITLVPYGRGPNSRYSTARKVEYIAMRQVYTNLLHDMLNQVRIVENDS